MNIRDCLWNEIHEAKGEFLEVKWIRVTMEAIEGSPMTAPITPERLRLHAQIRVVRQDAPSEPLCEGVEHDPRAFEDWREIVIHPADWSAALREPPGQIDPLNFHRSPPTYYGVPVL